MVFLINISSSVNCSSSKKGSLKVDLSYIYKCVKKILSNIKKKKIILKKLNLPVGTGEEIEKIILKKKYLFRIFYILDFLRQD